MTDTKNNEQKAPATDNATDSNNDNLHGRVNNTANPAFEQEEDQADISHVDQQEGNMNHGELGGNLSNKEKGNE